MFPSDEFFLIAGLEPPAYDRYPEIPQLANGVGMYYRLYSDLEGLLESLPDQLPTSRRVAAITTSMGAKVIGRLTERMNDRVSNLQLEMLTVSNTLFGDGITVTGLLPGADFERAIKENPGFDRYLIPNNALRAWDKRFLDDVTLAELRDRTGVEIVTGGDTAADIAHAALHCDA